MEIVDFVQFIFGLFIGFTIGVFFSFGLFIYITEVKK